MTRDEQTMHVIRWRDSALADAMKGSSQRTPEVLAI